MSDYVDNFDQNVSMDAAPFSSGFVDPTTSDLLDDIDWENPSYEDLAAIDWSALHEEVMGVVVGEPADEQLQPGDCVLWSNMPMANELSSPCSEFNPNELSNFTTNPTFICGSPGCTRTFKRRGDRKRHILIHGAPAKFDCPAVDCNRVGDRGFARKDKLTDHMLAGHDDETMFYCSTCGWGFTRDLYSVHARVSYNLNDYRTCPMPRCSFKVYLGRSVDHDKLRDHLLQKHDTRSRIAFANLLEQKSYDALTCDVVCPVCPSSPRFSKHNEFYDHFVQTHARVPVCAEHEDGSSPLKCHARKLDWRLGSYTSVFVEIHQHRRAILRVCSGFKYYPVWEDIECRRLRA